jgi:hypothetical protein
MSLQNYYYSGQGSLLAAERNPLTGAPMGFRRVGNVPELTVDIEVTNFEHKESETGSRGLDLIINRERKGTFNFKIESITLENLAMGLMGDTASVAGATVADEPHIVAAGHRMPLNHPKVSAVVVSTVEATPVVVPALNNYTLDAVNGVIIWDEVPDGIDHGDPYTVDYTYGTYVQVDAFTQSSANERFLRFEGLNTVDDSRVIVDIFRAQFDPLTGYGLINEELASVDMTGAILADPFITAGSGSRFFRQRNFSA